jgi:UDP-N-acetylmuramoyl-tripeptide--D-alanyl-D-alanine ligase
VINGDNPPADRCAARAAMCDARVIRYGHGAFDARVLEAAPDGAGQRVAYDVLGTQVALRLAEPGPHWTMNALAALTLAVLAGGDAQTCAAALDGFGALEGRGAATSIAVPGGAVTLFDEAYNANPASMAAAIATLGGRPVAGRRIAALGDMLELGPDEGRYHAGVAADLDAANIDLVYCAGPRMKHLWDALPTSRKAGYAETAAELAPLVAASVKAGDAVMVKGSNGSRMRLVVEALKAIGDGHAL